METFRLMMITRGMTVLFDKMEVSIYLETADQYFWLDIYYWISLSFDYLILTIFYTCNFQQNVYSTSLRENMVSIMRWDRKKLILP